MKSDGRIEVYAPGHPSAGIRKYAFEHRLVMEKKLGRRLKPNEIVHHVDGDVKNNNPVNLELFNSQAEHLRFHWQKRKHG